MRTHGTDATVIIDSFPRNAARYKDKHAIVCVDVIRATTTAITAVAEGRRCFPAGSLETALALFTELRDERPLLAGELSKNRMADFGMPNSPVHLVGRTDVERPLILFSSSGTELIQKASGGLATFLACLRNIRAAAAVLIGRYRKVAVIGAGSGDDFSVEDQLCCAWIARELVSHGYRPETKKTEELILRWQNAHLDVILHGLSAKYLLETSQRADLDFILSHINDIPCAFMVADNEVLMIPAPELPVAEQTSLSASRVAM